MLACMCRFFERRWILAVAMTVTMTAGGAKTTLAADAMSGEPAGEGEEEVSGDAFGGDHGGACDNRGLCIIHGDRTSLLGGRAQTYVQLEEDGRPRALGLKFTRSMLSNLPYEPPFDGNNCFDINGDGELSLHSPMPECAGGYQAILFFPERAVKQASLPFKWFLLNWNPMGHGPIGIYDRPHFDFHFYIMDSLGKHFLHHEQYVCTDSGGLPRADVVHSGYGWHRYRPR
jgi:hypothetical protein